MEDDQFTENRGRQLAVGATILAILLAIVVGVLLGWRYLPGWVGESVGMAAGIMTTPFFMEASFVVIGLIIVVGLNIWRQRKGGDEFVEIDMTALDAVDPARLEAELEAGNHDEAAALLRRMDERQLSSSRVLRIRIALAEKSGDTELADQLRRAMQHA
jgi:hypothetical protein